MKRSMILLAALVSGVLSAAEMPNLLKNGSFEEGVDAKGNPVGWRVEKNDGVDGVVELSDKHVFDGKKSLHFNKKNTRGSIYIQQEIRLKPDTDYVLELKGFRTATYRFHSIGIRQPDSSNKKETKLPDNGGTANAVLFHTVPGKSLTYIYFGLWGYTKENNKQTIGEMWIDSVSLREVQKAGNKAGK